jgi:hypothetical protein
MSSAETLAAKLRDVFGERLQMVAAFGHESQLCAVTASITMADLTACASAFGGRTPPLLMTVDELSRALDAFPLEFSEIIATRQLIAGTDLLEALKVPLDDLRRACEVQARGHLLHLRQGFVEAGANQKSLAQLIASSHAPFRALLMNVARLDGTNVDELISRLGLVGQAFSDLLHGAERLVDYVDKWKKA